VTTDTELTWRECPTCGYLVPAQQAVCTRCTPATTTAPDPIMSPSELPPPPSASEPPSEPGASSWPAPTEPPPAATPPPVAPSAPGAWSAGRAGEILPPPPPGGPGAATSSNASFRRTGLVVAAIVVIVALVGAGLATTVLRTSDHPSHWDPRLGDLPATVARLRGLQFEHPVPVRYESASRFVKEQALGASKQTAAQRRASTLAAESLRAIGLVSGKVDLFAASKTARENRVLAFYDPDAKEVVIRGGTKTLDVPHRVVLAHELTHVLQDQHFDLNRLEGSVRRAPGQSPQALRTVIEGDANRIEKKYLSGLSGKDRDAFRTWERKGLEGADTATADVPAVISLLQGAPYAFGPLVLEVVAADGGNAAVDRVFEHGVFTQQLFVEPAASLTEPAPEPIAAPKAAAGEKTIGTPDALGAFDLYLLLASRIDGADALAAASTWSGGRSRTVRTDGRVCQRAVVAASTPSGARELERDLRRWSAALPAGMATVRRDGSRVALRSCDPGAAPALSSPDAAIVRARNLLVAHNEIEVALVGQAKAAGMPLRTVRCAALEFVRSPQLSVVLALPEADVTPAQVRDAISAAAPAVRTACGL
jgi:hypothetical protein